MHNGKKESMRCTYIQFPDHPCASKRTNCNTLLLKWINVKGKSKLVPKKTFLYNSIIQSLERLVNRDDFLEKCNLCRSRENYMESEMYGDIYEGKVWKEFLYHNGTPFLLAPNNFALSVNIDWFNPYGRTLYSVGAIYLVILNLPRHDRYKIENMILAGLIPGPNEPKGVINNYLRSLVDDFITLYEGVYFRKSKSYFGRLFCRAVLICVSCDLPATRKVCGFLSHNATRGCSKCTKKFQEPNASFNSKPNYSGFECEDWPIRRISEHRRNINEILRTKTATARSEAESKYGIRYSELLRIPYFDVVRFHVIDPMHNVFLGLAKHFIETLRNTGRLVNKNFEAIQTKVDSVNPPPNIGRIPRKICAGFSSITADEWKNWILVYSLYAFKGELSDCEYGVCWFKHVRNYAKL